MSRSISQGLSANSLAADFVALSVHYTYYSELAPARTRLPACGSHKRNSGLVRQIGVRQERVTLDIILELLLPAYILLYRNNVTWETL